MKILHNFHLKKGGNYVIKTENHVIILRFTSNNFDPLRSLLIYKNDCHPYFASPAIQLLKRSYSIIFILTHLFKPIPFTAMKKLITMPNAIALSHTHTCNFSIINELKSNSFVKLLVVALIVLPSFLSTFSSGKSWGGGLYAQIPNAVFDANDAHKGILIPRVSLLSATDTVTVHSPGVSLLLYNTATVGVPPNNLTTGFYFWNGTKWQPISGTRSFEETFVEFYSLMPSNNTATIAPGSPISFPQNGPTSGTITRSSVTPTSEFVIPEVGTYSITWQVSIAEAGQLVLMVNGVEDARTVVGRATGTSQIIGNTLLTTSTVNTIVSLNNPTGNPVALTVSPIAGGTKAVSASIIIKRLQ